MDLTSLYDVRVDLVFIRKLRALTAGDPTAREFIQKLFAVSSPDEDNEMFLRKLRSRLDKVGLRLPTVEVRYENYSVEGETLTGGRALPTLPNALINSVEVRRRCSV
ncbi:hypothetical protein R1sor_008642 [Riccia sorocarpa]|uniref:Pleiotropic ABC efflux transporter N-terminal domain-containing protein n=1 Tax=Riccia sorocarpa TaxID=122646 RepID=A0ABD3HY48_9MARC